MKQLVRKLMIYVAIFIMSKKNDHFVSKIIILYLKRNIWFDKIDKIEKPFKPGVKTMRELMMVMSEHQFTLNEIGSGVAYEALKRQYENKVL